jgi:hypothetical protein
MRRTIALVIAIGAAIAGAVVYKSLMEPELGTIEASADETAPAVAAPVAMTVPLNAADQYVGKKIQLLLKDGTKSQGKLEAVKPNALVVEQRLSGGTISMEISKSRIAELQVY